MQLFMFIIQLKFNALILLLSNDITSDVMNSDILLKFIIIFIIILFSSVQSKKVLLEYFDIQTRNIHPLNFIIYISDISIKSKE